MAENSKIEWTDDTASPWYGCTKIAAGCANYYAADLSKRNPKTLGVWGDNGVRIKSKSFADDLRKWNRKGERQQRRIKIFPSMCDPFEDRPELDDWRAEMFSVIDECPWVILQLLTKRPENIPAMWPHADQHANEYPPAPSEEIMQPIEGYPNYFVSNFGLVYSSNGSHCCLFCGKHIEGGVANRKYCDQRCNDNAYKSRRRGDAQQVEQSMRQVAVDVGDQGHCRVTLYRDGESRHELVHRLVLTAFVRPPERGEQGCHRDRNPKNNRIDNLRWGTQSGNWDDSIHHGTHRRSNKLTEHQVADIRSRLASGESYAALGRSYSVSATQIGNIDKNLQWRETTGFRRNCWIGCSIANQADADRNIPLLLKCRDLSPVLFVSAEPLLGPVNLNQLLIEPASEEQRQRGKPDITFNAFKAWQFRHHDPIGIDWLICGGESGPHARPMHPDWARSLRDQCQAATVPFFFKQWGEFRPYGESSGWNMSGVDTTGRVFVGLDGAIWNDPDYETRHPLLRVGKVAAGRLLDGREWSGFPKVSV